VKKKPAPKAKDDPKLIFGHGEMYRQAFALLQGARLLMPSFVCAALSLELYFKALIADEKGETPDGHDLQFLFSRLSKDKQDRIRHFFNLTLPARRRQHQILDQFLRTSTPLPTFEQSLDSSKRAFIMLRYSYQTRELRDQEGWSAQEIWQGTNLPPSAMRPSSHFSVMSVCFTDWPRFKPPSRLTASGYRPASVPGAFRGLPNSGLYEVDFAARTRSPAR
jgi:HEPN domain-containing protein